MYVLVYVVDFFLHGVKQEPIRVNIIPSMGVPNLVGLLTGTFSVFNGSSNFRMEYIFQGYVSNIVTRRLGGGAFYIKFLY